MGPGKAALLEAIDREGSISAGGRALAMSYRRSWRLVDTMNRCWQHPLVETLKGGGRERGARLTPFGRQILQRYRELETRLADESGEDHREFESLMRHSPLRQPS